MRKEDEHPVTGSILNPTSVQSKEPLCVCVHVHSNNEFMLSESCFGIQYSYLLLNEVEVGDVICHHKA